MFSRFLLILSVLFIVPHVVASSVAGNDILGNTSYTQGALRLAEITDLTNDGDITCAVIDTLHGYAYFGTRSNGGAISRVVKVALGNGNVPPRRVGAVALNANEGIPGCAVIDPIRGYAYFGVSVAAQQKNGSLTTNLPPFPALPPSGLVVKIKLENGDTTPTRIGAMALNLARPTCAVIDSDKGYAYFGCDTIVAKVALGDGDTLPTRVGSVSTTVSEIATGVIDPAAGYAYFGIKQSSGHPGVIAKIGLGDGSDPPSFIGYLVLNADETGPTSSVIDPVAGYAYFGTSTAPGRVVKIALGTGDAFPTRVNTLILNSNENYLSSAVIDSTTGYAYFGTDALMPNPGQIIKVFLGNGNIAPIRIDSILLSYNEGFLESGIIDLIGGFAYFGERSLRRLVRISFSEKGYSKLTRFTLPEPGTVESLSFYSHKAAGRVRLALFRDDAPSFRTRVWQSESTSNTQTEGFVEIPIANGTPNTLSLNPGQYHFAWQIDTTADVPSYTPGAAGEGSYVVQPYGPFPTELRTDDAATSWTTTNEIWTGYIKYLPHASANPVWLKIGK